MLRLVVLLPFNQVPAGKEKLVATQYLPFGRVGLVYYSDITLPSAEVPNRRVLFKRLTYFFILHKASVYHLREVSWNSRTVRWCTNQTGVPLRVFFQRREQYLSFNGGVFKLGLWYIWYVPPQLPYSWMGHQKQYQFGRWSSFDHLWSTFYHTPVASTFHSRKGLLVLLIRYSGNNPALGWWIKTVCSCGTAPAWSGVPENQFGTYRVIVKTSPCVRKSPHFFYFWEFIARIWCVYQPLL